MITNFIVKGLHQRNRYFIVKILKFYIILLCAHLYRFFPASIHYLQSIHCLLQYFNFTGALYCHFSIVIFILVVTIGLLSSQECLFAFYFISNEHKTSFNYTHSKFSDPWRLKASLSHFDLSDIPLQIPFEANFG